MSRPPPRCWAIRGSVTGEVVHGAKLGRTLGYPTANLALDQNCGLRHAIYAVEVDLDGAR